MAQRKPVLIDGDYHLVSTDARLSDVAPSQAQSVLISDGQIIDRSSFARYPVPDGFETNLTPQVKG